MRAAWRQAGFFIMADGTSPDWKPRLLPERIVTVSTCLAASYPDVWAVPWAQVSLEELRSIQEALDLTEAEFADLRSWVDHRMNDGEFGWPNVFLVLNVAREFSRRFLKAVSGTRLAGLSLEPEFATEFLRKEAPQENEGESGVWTMLKREEPLQQTEHLLGFDVLGAERGGSFHSFACNGLERDFSEKLGISFNRHGLISDYKEAVIACEHINRGDFAAEPVTWYPFRVDEYSSDD